MKSLCLPVCVLITFSGFSGLAGAAIPTGVTTKAVFETNGKNSFNMPVWFGEIPGQPKNFLVAEKNSGDVYLLSPAGAGYAKQKVLNVKVRTEVEQGLLSLAFHPDFVHNRKFYVHYSAPTGGARRLIVEEREMDATFLKDSGKPPRIIIEVPQVEGKAIHNGGNFTFGPDGMAYMSVGDGGDGANAQKRSEWMGNILRLKVDPADPSVGYKVPTDNPFVGQDGIKPEIWAYGLRNPWRMSWDMEGNELWEGEVGQSAWEEVNMIRKGDNMGWNILEGTHCNNCKPDGFSMPIKEIGRADANCIIGGMVFRGDKSSAFYGTYIFADHIVKNLFALTQNNRAMVEYAKIGTLPGQPNAFAGDAQGNLYVCLGSGQIHQLVHDELKPRTGTTIVSPKALAVDRISVRDYFRKENGGYVWAGGKEQVRDWELVALDGTRVASGRPVAAGILFHAHPGLYLIRLNLASGSRGSLIFLN